MLDLLKEICRSCWPTKRSHRIVLTTFGVLFVWFLTGLFDFRFDGDEVVEKKLLNVKVKTISSEDRVPETRVTGFTEEQRTVRIRAETDGQVIELPHKKGDQVKQGDVLVKLSLDTRRAKLAEAKALLEQRKLEYEVAQRLEKKSFRSKTNVANAKSKYESALATLEDIKTSIDDTQIVAPFDGIMDKNLVEVGSYAKVGDEVIEMVDLNPLKIVFYVTQQDLCCVQMGKKVRVNLSGTGEKEGIITYATVIADPSTRTFRVEAEIKNEAYALKSGMTAEILIPRDRIQAHLISAGLLILNDEGVLGVHTVDENNTVQFHKVDIMSHTEGNVWVSGLPNQPRLITVGQDFVIQGQEVIPVDTESVLAHEDTH